MSSLITMEFVLQGTIPLGTASINGRLEALKTLIKCGANVNQANKVSLFHFSYTSIMCTHTNGQLLSRPGGCSPYLYMKRPSIIIVKCLHYVLSMPCSNWYTLMHEPPLSPSTFVK